MAGGKGTRVASIAADIPKPMIPLCGKPVLEYQLDCLKRNGITNILIVSGHLGRHIKEYFGDGARFGCTISYYEETEPLGTAGALYALRDDLPDEFILLNGDIIFDIDFSRFIQFHHERGGWATLAVHPNSHPYDSALLVTDNENRIVQWLGKEDERQYYKNRVNAGIHIITKQLLDYTRPLSKRVDLDRDILKPALGSGNVYAYHTPEYIKDMGTPERCAQVSADIERGLVAGRNMAIPQKAVFLDRDGTINRLSGFITKPEDLVLIDGAAEGIRAINNAGYLAIVVTNQPVIARGEATVAELELIHDKLETELGKAGAYVDDLLYCPHHPDRGFPGERHEYKIDCECRKPKPGMLVAAAERYNIDLAASWMVGDDDRDTQAGIAAGCRTARVSRRSDLVSICRMIVGGEERSDTD
jgi:D,D-heptose 1,7-bisphosphate phosphatase